MDKKLVSAMVTFPNAKINLGLDILDRRTDGYHDISTVMVPVPWCDILEVVPAKDGFHVDEQDYHRRNGRDHRKLLQPRRDRNRAAAYNTQKNLH